MQHLGIKLGAIAGLIFLLLIPLLLIDGLVDERQDYRDEVLEDIARSSGYQQKLVGPLVVVPYTRTISETVSNESDQVCNSSACASRTVLKERKIRGNLYFLPETFVVDGQMRTEQRHRGIYEARLYHVESQISGSFNLPANYGISDDLDSYRFEKPLLAVGINDARGIENALKLKMNGELQNFQPGTSSKLLGDGVHVPLPLEQRAEAQRFDYAFELALLGSSRFSITPVGRDSQVKLTADWPHPSFYGEFLPVQREISDNGFNANWRTSFFSTNLEEVLQNCVRHSSCEQFNSRSFGVDLVDPVDQYLKTDRAVKYALLIIGLTFAGFFLFEVLKRLMVHPIQYALVGLALALFYLLLLSLSEHFGFAVAYLISSSACVLLIGFYLSFVLQSIGRSLGFSLGLGVLYGMLYALLSAEDYALLMGSVLLFVLLGGFMVLTRRLDWYSLGKGRSDKPSFSLDDVQH